MAIKLETIDELVSLCSKSDDLVILDVGCGDRSYEKYIGNNKYIGIDVEISGRDHDHKSPDLFFDGEHIPFNSEEIDIILFLEVYEHVKHPEKLMSEIHRVLKTSGIVVFSCPFLWPLHEVPYDFRRLSMYGAEDLFKNLGFRVQSSKRLHEGWSGLSKLFNSLSEKSSFNVTSFLFRFMALVFKIFNRVGLQGPKEIYLTNLLVVIKQS